jgi:hypothetical protein
MRSFVLCAVFDIGSDGLKHHVEVALDAESCSPRRDVEPMRTEVMEDRGAAVEKRLDVDQLPRPISLVEDTLAKRKAIRPRLFRMLRLREIPGIGQAQHTRLSN